MYIVSYWLHKELFFEVTRSPKLLDTLMNILASFLLMKMSGDIFIF